jgi:uncharacterized membrane protein
MNRNEIGQVELNSEETAHIKSESSQIGNLESSVFDFFNEAEKYHELFNTIVNKSFDYVNENSKYKKKARKWFSICTSVFILAQYVLVTILAIYYDIPESVIVALISGVLLSTLGLVTIMVRFLFNDEAETEVIKDIQNVAGSYKKTGQNDDTDRIMINK